MSFNNIKSEEIEQINHNVHGTLQCTLQDNDSKIYINNDKNNDRSKCLYINLNIDSNSKITKNNHFEETLLNPASLTGNPFHDSANVNHQEYLLHFNPQEPCKPKSQEKQPSQSRNAYFSRISRMRRREREERLQEWNHNLEISNRELLKANSELEDKIHSLHYTNKQIRCLIRHPLWPIGSPMLQLTAPRYEIESDMLKLNSKTCWLDTEVSHLQHITQHPNPGAVLPSHDTTSFHDTKNHPPSP